MDLLHIPEEDKLLEELLLSLRHYGKVCQIKQFFCGGYFEGKLSVLMDVSTPSEDALTIRPLDRMLYLPAWDTYVPASFKGASPPNDSALTVELEGTLCATALHRL
ncbi:hypothetical protein G6F46_015145 [Rhizopus delemar]|uniref:Uncharacterized protein n=1 Tax=Rhizopus delemar TaxID=936053 RepID=A0A9P7C1K7_9FUNG|nr:hypothetical protein G6F54_014154 [Rhizopus delemar]KAG1606227.1 hypothetical protein G6F45_014030 [Rhizopus arrhizus]KAG1483921.1 hypothetical protein G6F53_014041 [Rhizopus delemar]KAG1490522.1 hypothetical protein G6F52_013601 [Rhizopus delemar]KAG1531134.1 hypothetical protein G6F50_016876 [Rhizopus delemar]